MAARNDVRNLIIAVHFGLLMAIGPAVTAHAQPAQPNYDESKVPEYSLPDPLVMNGGGRVTNAQTWWQQRRPEILTLFQREMYGRSPGRPAALRWQVWDDSAEALGGAARRKQVTIYLSDDEDGPRMELLLYLPRDAQGPVPAFLGLNFGGNHSIVDDHQVRLPESWMRGADREGVVDHRATEAGRGDESLRAGRCNRYCHAVMPWPRSTTATSILISTTDFKMVCIRCFIRKGKPSLRRTNGDRSLPGPGDLAAHWITWWKIPISIRNE